MTAILKTSWPAMQVHPVRLLKQWLTADEVAVGELTGDAQASLPTIDLPPTPVAVHRGAALAILFGNGEIGTVADCTARYVSPDGLTSLFIYLDTELVVMESGIMIAKSMPATAKVFLSDGSQWSSDGVAQPEGYGCFPDCPLVNGVASPVTASFVLEKV